MVIKIRGRKHWLWRAVDDEGEVLDFLVQPRRCARSARRLLRKLLKKQGFARSGSRPISCVPMAPPFDRNAYPPFMIRVSGPTIGRRTHTNRSGGENAKCSGSNRLDLPNAFSRSTPQCRTSSTVQRHLVPRRIYKQFRNSAFEVWRECATPA